MVLNAEEQIFGGEEAFSQRWTHQHGLPDVIPADPERGIARPFSPAEVFSDIAETGISDQPTWYRASLAIEASADKNFRRAARNGFLRLFVLEIQGMRSSRIDTVAGVLKSELGVAPQGIAQWLMIDRETRRSLCLLLRLQGYQVANEEGTNDRVPGLDVEGKLPTVGKKFSDLSLRPDQLKQYLDAVQAAVKTDPGVVRLAYTIFRCLGFPHGNAKFAGDLYGHLYDGSKGDFTLTEIGPFVDRFSEPGTNRTLTEVIKTDGMIGLAVALNKLPAEKLGREWENMKLLLDLGDKVEDIRNGTGASGGMKYKDRQAIVMAMEQKIDEFAVAQAKRLLEPETMVRLKDPRRVKFQKGMLEARPKGFTDLIKDLAIEIPGVGDRRPTK